MRDSAIEHQPHWVDRDWLAVVAAICGQILSVGTLTVYIFGVFIPPLQAEFGWTRTQLVVAVSITQYTLGVITPLWGFLSDRLGPRVLQVPMTVVLAALVAGLSLMTANLWHFYLMFLLISLFAPSPVLYSMVLVRLFRKRLGMALGLMMVGVGLGSTVLPMVSQALIASFGWRVAYIVLGVATVCIGIPAALVATRHVRSALPRPPGAAVGSVWPAVRTPLFLRIALVFVLLGFVTTGTVPHLAPMMMDRHFSAAEAARVASLTGLTALIARGGVGWVLDRVPAPRVLGCVALLGTAALLLLAWQPFAFANYLAALMLGLVVGAEVDFVAFLARSYFAPGIFGRLFGLLFLAFTVGGGTGPIVMGMSFDRLGSYTPGLVLLACLAAVAGGIAFSIQGKRGPQAAAEPDNVSQMAVVAAE